VRKTGVAFDREEHTLGICAAAVVMRDRRNDLAISCRCRRSDSCAGEADPERLGQRGFWRSISHSRRRDALCRLSPCDGVLNG